MFQDRAELVDTQIIRLDEGQLSRIGANSMLYAEIRRCVFKHLLYMGSAFLGVFLGLVL